MKISLNVVKVQVTKRVVGADRITLILDPDTSKSIHGDRLEIWGSAYLDLEVTKGRYPVALRALGIEEAEVIDADTGTTAVESISAGEV